MGRAPGGHCVMSTRNCQMTASRPGKRALKVIKRPFVGKRDVNLMKTVHRHDSWDIGPM